MENYRKRLKRQDLLNLLAYFCSDPPPASHIIGSKQMCGVWTSPNLRPISGSMLPHYFGVGDHRCFVLDFSVDTFLGEGFVPICKPEMRRLTSKQPKAVQNYLRKAESLFLHHKCSTQKLDLFHQHINKMQQFPFTDSRLSYIVAF